MADRTFESASIARRSLEEEFDRNVPGRTSGLLPWISIGVLFGSVFVVCGGIGAILGGRELMTRGEGKGLAPEAALIRDVTPSSRPAPDEPDPPAAPVADDDAPVGEEEPEPVEDAAEARPTRERPRPRPRPRPAAPAPRPAPEPEPAPEPAPVDDLEVETDDLLDPWSP